MKPTRQAIINVVVVATLSTLGGVVIAGMMTGETTPSDVPTAVTPVELVAVPVAVKDIPAWTKFTKDNVGDYFEHKQFRRKVVPPGAVLDLEELSGKWVNGLIRQGEMVEERDLRAKGSIDPPEGTVQMTIPITLEQSASGFALPGYKVMFVATRKSEKKQKEIVFPILYDALILSVDASTGVGPQQMISIAVSEEQVDLLAQVLECSEATISIKLPSCDEGWKARETAREIFLVAPKTSDEVRAFLADE